LKIATCVFQGQEEDDGEDHINDEPEEERQENDENSYRRRGPPRRRRFRNNYRRPRRRGDERNSESEEPRDEAEGDEEGEGQRRRAPRNTGRRGRMNRRSHDPSIYVGGLPCSLRVSEFKEKVHDRSVQPLRVVWHGGSGHAFLQFPNIDVAEEAIQALKDLDLGGRQIKVELARSNRSDREDSRNDEADGELADGGSD